MYQEVRLTRGTEAGGELMWATRSAPPNHFVPATGLQVICTVVRCAVISSLVCSERTFFPGGSSFLLLQKKLKTISKPFFFNLCSALKSWDSKCRLKQPNFQNFAEERAHAFPWGLAPPALVWPITSLDRTLPPVESVFFCSKIHPKPLQWKKKHVLLFLYSSITVVQTKALKSSIFNKLTRHYKIAVAQSWQYYKLIKQNDSHLLEYKSLEKKREPNIYKLERKKNWFATIALSKSICNFKWTFTKHWTYQITH